MILRVGFLRALGMAAVRVGLERAEQVPFLVRHDQVEVGQKHQPLWHEGYGLEKTGNGGSGVW